jgi:hypothetical protein
MLPVTDTFVHEMAHTQEVEQSFTDRTAASSTVSITTSALLLFGLRGSSDSQRRNEQCTFGN